MVSTRTESGLPVDRPAGSWAGFLDVAWTGSSLPAETDRAPVRSPRSAPFRTIIRRAAWDRSSATWAIAARRSGWHRSPRRYSASKSDRPEDRGARWLLQVAHLPLSVFVPSGSQYWMRNRAEGPRRAVVSAVGPGGVPQFVVLEESEGERTERPQELASSEQALERASRSARGGSACSRSRLTTNPADRADGGAARSSPGVVRRACRSAGASVVAASSRRSAAPPWAGASSPMRADTASDLVNEAERRLRGGCPDDHAQHGEVSRVYRHEFVPSGPNRLAFVYPGLGNHFAGMGRELSALWPDVLLARTRRTAISATSSIRASGGTAICPDRSPTTASRSSGRLRSAAW